MRILAVALNTFREAIRNKILYSIVLFVIVLVGVSTFFGSVSIGDKFKIIKDFSLFALSISGALLTIISGVSLLNKELKQKTIYNILSKPVRRGEFIIGKYLGLTMTVSVLVSIMGICIVAFLAVLEKQIDWLLFQAIVFALLEVIVIAAVAIFFSSLVVTTTLAALFTLGTYVAGRSLQYLYYFLKGEGDETLLEGFVAAMNWIFPDFAYFNVNDQIVYGVAISSSYFLSALLYALSYAALLLTLATLIFEKRELP